jgi:hypothetical protein
MEDASTSTTAESKSTPSGNETRPSENLGMLQLLVAASTLIGGAAYAIVRIALHDFYSAFGITPEDVGWNITSVLTRFALPFVVLLLCALLLVLRFQEGELRRTDSLFSLLISRKSRWLFVVGLVFGCAMLVLFARQKVSVLRRGVPLVPSLDSMVPISAPCVNIFWLDMPEPRATLPPFDAQHKFYLLGEAEGRTVIYDATSDTTFRLPMNRLLLKHCAK